MRQNQIDFVRSSLLGCAGLKVFILGGIDGAVAVAGRKFGGPVNVAHWAHLLCSFQIWQCKHCHENNRVSKKKIKYFQC